MKKVFFLDRKFRSSIKLRRVAVVPIYVVCYTNIVLQRYIVDIYSEAPTTTTVVAPYSQYIMKI